MRGEREAMEIYIGDTPEQLGSYQTADASIVGDKVVTKADYLALVAQVERWKTEYILEVRKHVRLHNKVYSGEYSGRMPEGMIYSEDYLIQNAVEVIEEEIGSNRECLREIQEQALQDLYKFGFTPEQYHLFKQSKDGLALQAEAGRLGWLACWNWVSSDSDLNLEQKTFEDFANEYAERIRQGGGA
jgi:hypothetical protein